MKQARYVTCLVYQTLGKGVPSPLGGEDKTRHVLIHHAGKVMPGRYWHTLFKQLRQREGINTIAYSYTQKYSGQATAGKVEWSHEPISFL